MLQAAKHADIVEAAAKLPVMPAMDHHPNYARIAEEH